MKKLLILSSILILLTACSRDDLSSNLTEVIIQKYNNGIPSGIQHYYYSDGKINQITYYNSNSNFRVGYTKYGYYSNGSLLSIVNRDSNNRQVNAFEYIYDEYERLAFKKYTAETITESYYIDYTYNNDNTITAKRMGNGESLSMFYLNSDNIIYKETFNGEEYTVTYNGTNPTLATDGSNNRTFEYDELHNRLLLNDRNKDNLYLSNNILMADNLFDGRNSTADKYLIKETAENGVISSITKYDYIFNDIGLPTNRKEYLNDILVEEREYIYQ
ncbi:hypothetical protein [Flavobacterium beibuense]|uniref:hypothetical protein n=1 Tax=Flavobacterium beibuense TaxID=657326 RepID=UPI003A94A287